ncbi:uncharacterized protein LOC141641356 [Silene latifolia]|uniref:uncharacterized protein LOC141641356 n=1 Tax=Silene latifolia TaxID=37657 RepID=UPI003D770668
MVHVVVWECMGSGGFNPLIIKNEDEVNWTNLVWNNWSIPIHSMLAWIYHHKSLNTNGKLHKLGIRISNTCYICEAAIKTEEHLYFACEYSSRVITLMGSWLRVDLPMSDVLPWRLSRGSSKTRRNIINAVINACVYQIWHKHNTCKFEQKIVRPEKYVRLIIAEIRGKIMGLLNDKLREGDRKWIERALERNE